VCWQVVQAVMAFVKENIGQQNYRLREAAVMAFGTPLHEKRIKLKPFWQ